VTRFSVMSAADQNPNVFGGKTRPQHPRRVSVLYYVPPMLLAIADEVIE